VLVKQQREVPRLVVLGCQPHNQAIVQHGVEQHQPLHQPAERCPSAIPVVGLIDGVVQPLVVQVVEPPAMERARPNLAGKASADQSANEVVRLLPMGDAGKRAVLPLDEHAPVTRKRA
jgi:hypothetical protein